VTEKDGGLRFVSLDPNRNMLGGVAVFRDIASFDLPFLENGVSLEELPLR